VFAIGRPWSVVSIAPRGASRNGSSAATLAVLACGASGPHDGIGSKGCSENGFIAGGFSIADADFGSWGMAPVVADLEPGEIAIACQREPARRAVTRGWAAARACARASVFYTEVLARGSLLHPRHLWFSCAAHDEASIDRAVEACDHGFARVAREHGER